jgi:hypothetical protein
MHTHDPGARGREPGDADREAKAEALDVLFEVLDWQLTPARWADVGQIISSMASAAADGDADTLRRATTRLELEGASSTRIIRIGTVDESLLDFPPEPVRDRVNRLIHALGAAAQPERVRSTRQADSHDDGSRGRP